MNSKDLYLLYTMETDGFPEYMESLGADSERWLKDVGIDRSITRSGISFVSWNAVCDLFERGAKDLDEPQFGLKWAMSAPEDYNNTGASVFLGSIRTDLRETVKILTAYQNIRTNGIRFDVVENEALREITCDYNIHPHSAPHRQMLEHVLALTVVMAQKFIPGYSTKYVTFQFQEPDDLSLYNQIFQAPITWGAERNVIAVDTRVLDENEKLSVISPILKTAARTYLKRHLKRHPHANKSIASTVSETLPSIMGLKGTDMSSVAEYLNMHPKKLQRLLKDEGENYSDILDQVRKSLASRLLTHSDVPIGRIAKMLDYSSDRPFNIAFKRWYDISPRAFAARERERHNSKPSLDP